ncbi:unnamed protein product [Rhizoctonia solani]|uniref:Uncharacterized protein n=1 Tax=Rhizoctonia solani TaxID=456999 RepID=A0A8H3HXL1_9AGAM|nr:unnamed protein product [Rhizoctonia solani]
MITDYATSALEPRNKITPGRSHVCKVCENTPAIGEVSTSESRILQHLLDVHGISEPKIDEHYSPKILVSEPFGAEDYDSDDSFSGYYFKFDTEAYLQHVFNDAGYGYGEDNEDW